MSKQEKIQKRNYFLKVGKNYVIILQLYVMPSTLKTKAFHLDQPHFEFLIRTLQEPITSRMKDLCKIKKQAKTMKSECSMANENGLRITYTFRKNTARDFVILQNSIKNDSDVNFSCNENISALPVFHERIIVTVDGSVKDDQVAKEFASSISEYFGSNAEEETFSAKRKKCALSKIKSKMAAKKKNGVEENESCSCNIVSSESVRCESEIGTTTVNIAEICKRFEFKQRVQKSASRSERSYCSESEELQAMNKVNFDQADRQYPSDTIIENETEEHDTKDYRTNDTFNSKGCMRSFLGDSSKSGAVVDRKRSLKRRRKNVRPLEMEKTLTDVEQNDREKDSHKTDNVISKRRLKNNKKVIRSKKLRNSDGHISINVDDYGDICLDDVSCVTQLTSHQIRLLVRSLERDVRDIFEGKSFSRRHQDYKQGGKTRAELAFKVHYGNFTEDQQDSITDSLRQMFCYKHTKYFDYVLKVLVPETMILILEKVNKDIDHAEAERLLANERSF